VFGLSGGEILVVLLLAAWLIGPTKLPAYARRVGRFVRKARATWADTQAEATEGIRRELDGIGVDVDELRPAALMATLRGDDPAAQGESDPDPDPDAELPTPPPPPLLPPDSEADAADGEAEAAAAER
jgi:sec-independent protein translocase protein TatB